MTKARSDRQFMGAVVEKARRLSRRKVYLAIVVLHLMVMSPIGYGVLSIEVGNAWKAIEKYRDARDHQRRTRERGEQFKEVLSSLMKLQRGIRARGALEEDAAMAHSLVRQSAEKTGLRLKGFVVMDAEDEHLVTLEGAFRNVVMLVDALPRDLSSFRVRRFIVRLVSSRGDPLEVEILIKKSPNTPELSPVCNTEVR